MLERGSSGNHIVNQQNVLAAQLFALLNGKGVGHVEHTLVVVLARLRLCESMANQHVGFNAPARVVRNAFGNCLRLVIAAHLLLFGM